VSSIRDFRLLFAGVSTSLLGDQFALIATPWLVLQLTDDPLALGTVLALEGIPRALFMLFGGAITDRFSPLAIMLAIRCCSMCIGSLDGGCGLYQYGSNVDGLCLQPGLWIC
jgi:MFS family permease